MMRALYWGLPLLGALGCPEPEPLPTTPTGETAAPTMTTPTGETGTTTEPVFTFDVAKEAFAAFRADEGVTLGANDEVTAWADLGGTFTAVVDPPASEGITVFVDGTPSLDFDGTSNLVVDLKTSLTDATIFVRFRYDATQSDNDYLYAIGDGKIDTKGGTTMSLSRGSFKGKESIESYHYTGKDELYGARIASDVWITSTQLYQGTKQPKGTSHHTLFLDGTDAQMDPADQPYNALGNLTIGNYSSGEFRLVNAEIRGFVIFDRILEAKEIEAVEAWLEKL